MFSDQAKPPNHRKITDNQQLSTDNSNARQNQSHRHFIN